MTEEKKGKKEKKERAQDNTPQGQLTRKLKDLDKQAKRKMKSLEKAEKKIATLKEAVGKIGADRVDALKELAKLAEAEAQAAQK